MHVLEVEISERNPPQRSPLSGKPSLICPQLQALREEQRHSWSSSNRMDDTCADQGGAGGVQLEVRREGRRANTRPTAQQTRLQTTAKQGRGRSKVAPLAA